MGGLFTKCEWRDPSREEWTQEKVKLLFDEIKSIDRNTNETDRNKTKSHVLLCGPNHAGKSSFMNSVIGVGNGRQSHCSIAGGKKVEGTALTKKLIRLNAPDAFNNFCLSDIPGFLEPMEGGIHVDYIMTAVKGHIKPGYMFQDGKPIEEGDVNYVPKPTAGDIVHCVVIVIDVTKLRVLNTNYKLKIHKIIEKLHTAEIPIVAVLTKIDLLDKAVDKNIREMHESTKVRAAVTDVNKMFGIEERSIFPVKNLVKDIDIKPLTKIPHLLALRTILSYARNFIDVNIKRDN